MKNKIYVLLILFLIFAQFVFFPVYANGDKEQDIITGMGKVLETDNSIGTDTGVVKVINVIIGGLQLVGSGISVIVVTYLGIKYIIASVEEKAEIKKQAIPIVIGCILLFGALQLMKAVQSIGDEINK